MTFLKHIFILETLDSGISLEGMNLLAYLPRADIKPPRFSKRAAWQKNTIMTFCETNHQTIIGPDQEHVSPMKMYIHGPMDARPVIPHARPSSHREGKSVPEYSFVSVRGLLVFLRIADRRYVPLSRSHTAYQA